jgi:MarR family 2-MHQ and catechol resistance regulon transcriptional repressor
MKPRPIRDDDGVHLWVILWRAARAVERVAADDIAASGLSRTDFAIMEAVMSKGPLPVNEIAGKALLTSGAMTAAVDRLEKAGMVKRTPSPDDRRVRVVTLTAQGRRRIRTAFARHRARIDALFETLDRDQRATLGGLLKNVGYAAQRDGERSGS